MNETHGVVHALLAKAVSQAEDTDVPLRVFRSSLFEPYEAYRKLTGKKAGAAMDIATNTEGKRKGMAESLSEWIRATFFIPDARMFWRGPAVRLGKKIIEEEGIDLILSSAPPYTCHLIGEALAKSTGKPWIADFRDSWVDWLSAPKRRLIPKIIDVRMEGSVLKNADRLLYVTTGVKSDLLSRHPEVPDSKWALVPNGFDEADFAGISATPPADKFTLTYTGSMYGKRNPRGLLAALDLLFAEYPEMKEKVRLRFVGRLDDSILEDLKAYAAWVEHIPYVPHSESVWYLLNSNALLLIIDNSPLSKSIVTGKVYEYLGSRRPILALAPEGEAAQLIRETGAGEAADSENPEAIARAFLILYQNWRNPAHQAQTNSDAITAYSRRALTGSLAKILDQMAP